MPDLEYPHFLLRLKPNSEKYTNPTGRSSEFPIYLGKDPQSKGKDLRGQLEKAGADFLEIVNLRKQSSIQEDLGMFLTFESLEGYELWLTSFSDKSSGIEIENVQKKNGKTFVTVYIPNGKLSVFFKKIEQYLDQSKNTEKGNPKNQKLLNNIETIKLSTLENFWNDNDPFPEDHNNKLLLEIWLRVGDDRSEINSRFREVAIKSEILVSDRFLSFPESSVFKVTASINQLKSSVMLLDCLSEIRKSKETPASFLDMTPMEETDWVLDLRNRLEIHPDHRDVAVCILDTGVNVAHPLLAQSIEENDLDSFHPEWGKEDHHGHGTSMAGLALLGDLFPILLSSSSIELKHRLESIKILPPKGQNPKELFGIITGECVSRAEIKGNRRRLFHLAITAPDFQILIGEPSSWSAALDLLAFGVKEEDEPKRLFFVSAGNLIPEQIKNYPTANRETSIEDPAQAWNVITVGAFTEKINFEKSKYRDWAPVAKTGNLSPTSTTTVSWNQSDWPFKPDIVMEGGNFAKNQREELSSFDSLSILTTNSAIQERLLFPIVGTSAATAQATRYGAILSAEYPDFWPETIRGMLIHSADYSALNLDYSNIQKYKKEERKKILRTYGYGVPDLNSALESGKNSCTMIIQDSISPFVKGKDGISTNEILYYSLPWPKSVLQEFSTESVQLKVTLSYFIEPNPKRINAKMTSTYACCGLRFGSIGATESAIRFQKRMNRNSREKIGKGKWETGFSNSENSNWVFGSTLRDQGSIHSDIWIGSAADLATKEKFVYSL
ncbi:peptidase, S8/S53 family [Leptospira weilii serovar Topaz str. LT2116]|uniref:Peptidase, S8/S53 family n=1 Tax=Leptospira weilii serovar Topaz str. LT2116 TaxID=1088540 RepID=M3EH39_9LEPT|nr:peptidase, S8/S53 family [Leptospira weilii serovar Topaz str. LT2116]